MKYLDAITSCLKFELSKENLYILGQDLLNWKGRGRFLHSLITDYSDKIIDTPISESATSGIATGLALGGFRVMVEYAFLDFILHSTDQIVNNSTKLQFFAGSKHAINLPIVYYSTINSAMGYGATHSQPLEYLFCNIPNLLTVYPSNSTDAQSLLKEALNASSPTLFINHKLLHDTEDDLPVIDAGKARVFSQTNDKSEKIVIVTYGRSTQLVREILTQLPEPVYHVDLRYLSKFDYQSILHPARKIVFVEEGSGVIMKQLIADLVTYYNLTSKDIRLISSKAMQIGAGRAHEEMVFVSKSDILDAIQS